MTEDTVETCFKHVVLFGWGCPIHYCRLDSSGHQQIPIEILGRVMTCAMCLFLLDYTPLDSRRVLDMCVFALGHDIVLQISGGLCRWELMTRLSRAPNEFLLSLTVVQMGSFNCAFHQLAWRR